MMHVAITAQPLQVCFKPVGHQLRGAASLLPPPERKGQGGAQSLLLLLLLLPPARGIASSPLVTSGCT
jgi:hypothetical protein